MPLIKGAKPGSPGFKKNVAEMVKSGHPVKQAVAASYSASGESKHTRSVPMKMQHHKKAAHHMKEAAKHHEMAKMHMEKMPHKDMKEDMMSMKKEVKKTALKKEKC